MTLLGIESTSLMLIMYGMGWFVVMFIKKANYASALRIAVIISAISIIFQLVMNQGIVRLWIFLLFHLANGICVAIGFYLFSFVLNNVERFVALLMIQIYYSLIPYMLWDITAVADFMKTYGSAIAIAVLLVSVFIYCYDTRMQMPTDTESYRTDRKGEGSAVPLILTIYVIYSISNFMSLFLEYDYDLAVGYVYGLGMFIANILIVIIQLMFNKSALHGWNLFLTFTLLGLAGLLFNNSILINGGSFAYGVGDGLGYIVILYLLGGAIKRSESLRMFRLTCLIYFIIYVPLVYGTDVIFAQIELPSQYIAFAIVLILICLSMCFSPVLSKRLFSVDWTDDYHMIDMGKFEELSTVVAVDTSEHLGLTPREKQIFTLLLTEYSAKQIAIELKISISTVNFHTANLYRKLEIQSRTELFAKYSGMK
jgi:DNA-binding CsgD family transcriptional regulator